MLSPEDVPGLRQRVLISQLITLAFLVGIAAFAAAPFATAAVLGPGQRIHRDGSIVAYVGVGLAAVQVGLHFVVPMFIRKGMIARLGPDAPPEKLLDAYQVAHFVAIGLLEGAAFFNLAAWMQARQAMSVVTAGVMALLILLRFPTRTGVAQWVESQVLARSTHPG